MSTTQSMNQSINAVTTKQLSPEEFKTAGELLSDAGCFRQKNTIGPNDKYFKYLVQCPKCNYWNNPRDFVYPVAKEYGHSRICLHCLFKRCNPDAQTLAEITAEQGRITITNQIQRMVEKYNEIFYNIYHHPKQSLHHIVHSYAACNEDKIFYYSFKI